MQVIKEVSWGNLLSASTIVVVAAIAWGTMSARVTATEKEVGETKTKVETTRNDISQMNTTIGRMDERMRSMEKSMDKQEMMLQEIVKKLK